MSSASVLPCHASILGTTMAPSSATTAMVDEAQQAVASEDDDDLGCSLFMSFLGSVKREAEKEDNNHKKQKEAAGEEEEESTKKQPPPPASASAADESVPPPAALAAATLLSDLDCPLLSSFLASLEEEDEDENNGSGSKSVAATVAANANLTSNTNNNSSAPPIIDLLEDDDDDDDDTIGSWTEDAIAMISTTSAAAAPSASASVSAPAASATTMTGPSPPAASAAAAAPPPASASAGNSPRVVFRGASGGGYKHKLEPEEREQGTRLRKHYKTDPNQATNLEKAWEFVSGVRSAHQELRQQRRQQQQELWQQWSKCGGEDEESSIAAVATDDMVFMVEKLLDCQDRFRGDGKDAGIDIGYHYTRRDNMKRIQRDGLLNRTERLAMNIVPDRYNGSSLGEGIYTGNNPFAYHGTYGDVGLLVARLKGYAVDANEYYDRQNNQQHGPEDTVHQTNPRRRDMIVLRKSCQCVPLVQFSSNVIDTNNDHAAGNALVYKYHVKLQQVVDRILQRPQQQQTQDGRVVTTTVVPRTLASDVVTTGLGFARQVVPAPQRPYQRNNSRCLLSQQQLAALRRHVLSQQQGGVRTTNAQVRQWVQGQFNVQMSRTTMQRYLKKVGVKLTAKNAASSSGIAVAGTNAIRPPPPMPSHFDTSVAAAAVVAAAFATPAAAAPSLGGTFGAPNQFQPQQQLPLLLPPPSQPARRGAMIRPSPSATVPRPALLPGVPINPPVASSNPTNTTTTVYHYKAPDTLQHPSDAKKKKPYCYVVDDSSSTASAKEECSICLDPLGQGDSMVSLFACGHCFHDSCIDGVLAAHSARCPICRKSTTGGKLGFGKMPSGSMTITTTGSLDCEGYDKEGSIEIKYDLQGGVQKSYHDRPGVSFGGTQRVAYLPNNDRGKKLLKRLECAFLHGWTFTIGTSLTTGQPNSIVWSTIHHKTSRRGGQPHGFPDPAYFINCNEELDALGVPGADDC